MRRVDFQSDQRAFYSFSVHNIHSENILRVSLLLDVVVGSYSTQPFRLCLHLSTESVRNFSTHTHTHIYLYDEKKKVIVKRE